LKQHVVVYKINNNSLTDCAHDDAIVVTNDSYHFS